MVTRAFMRFTKFGDVSDARNEKRRQRNRWRRSPLSAESDTIGVGEEEQSRNPTTLFPNHPGMPVVPLVMRAIFALKRLG
jgi:hypothetical protein